MNNKIINYKFKKYNSIGKEELSAAINVLKRGKLSEYIAGNNEFFYGGKNVRKFEQYLKKFYKVKYAITLNSWTSGLIAAIGALNIEPGDEIITTPWTMCACATSILQWNAIPVFADIKKENFCIDPQSIKKKISNKTKAILIVDIFGVSSDIKEIKKVIKGRNIKLITDSAQTPYHYYKNRLAGTLTDIGGFSLNCHKHINTGEGGIVVTNNKKLAERVCLIRNHGESKIKINEKLNNIIGYNFRMGEIEAAIGLSQYKKLKKIIKDRSRLFNFLAKELELLNYLSVPTSNYKLNNYYIFPILLNTKKIKYSRKFIIKELEKEGMQGLREGYMNINMLPIFQKKIAYGSNHYPWSLVNKKIVYKSSDCPVAEELHNKSFIAFHVCLYSFNYKDIKKIISTFKKVWKKLKI